MAEGVYCTLSEAARVLGVHYSTAARWARNGKLPTAKLSRGRVLVPKRRLDALLSSGAPTADPEVALPFGSPRRWLALAGTMTPEEGEFVRGTFEDLEKIE